MQEVLEEFIRKMSVWFEPGRGERVLPIGERILRQQ